MNDIYIKPYTEDKRKQWNQFIAQSNNGTIFHHLDFLNYHGDKFKDNEHHLIWYKGESIFAVMPMGIFEEDGKRIAKSPYGASWGGIVTPIKFKFKYALQIVELLLEYLQQKNVQEIVLTLPPLCYYKQYSIYIEFALKKFGFEIVNREVTSISPIPQDGDVTAIFEVRGRNSARKAQREGVVVKRDDNLETFYPILWNSKRILDAFPTHTLDELIRLKNRFPAEIVADVAYFENQPIAGILYFVCNPLCILTFYMAQELEFAKLNAMNLLVREGMLEAQKNQFRFFDFGCSTYLMEERLNIFEFKESFGAIGYFRDTYKLIL